MFDLGRAGSEEAQQKLSRLDKAFLFERSIDIDTYDRHADRVREQMTLLKISTKQHLEARRTGRGRHPGVR
ncbi:MAG: hypothetical protein WKG07_46165 [Hymenobacter sp.]